MEVTVNKQKIIFYKEATELLINKLRNEYARSSIDPKTNRLECMNVTLDAANKKLDILSDIISKIDEEQLDKMFDYLPIKKNGKIESKKIPIHIPGIEFYDIGDGWINKYQVALILEPKYARVARTIGYDIVKVPDEFELKLVTDANFDKKIIHMIDDNFNFTKLEPTVRKSTIKPEDLVPGKIYLDKKEHEFLYIGAIEHDVNFPGFISPMPTLEVSHYAFLKLNNKRKKEIAKYPSMAEYLKNCVKNKGWDEIFNNLRGESKSFKVVEESETMFDLDSIFCEINVNRTNFNGDAYIEYIKIPNKEFKSIYKVYNSEEMFIETQSKTEAEKVYKMEEDKYQRREITEWPSFFDGFEYTKDNKYEHNKVTKINEREDLER